MEEAHRRVVDTLRYYTGLPKPPCNSTVVEFQNEKEFVQLLHEGHPTAVAFTFRCAHTKHFDEMFARASEEFHPRVRFVAVDCVSHLGFCIARQRKDYPFVEIFHSTQASESGPRSSNDGITRYSVSVMPFNYDVSPYGFRKFFEAHGMS